MARDALTERRVAQAGTRQARSTAVDTAQTEAWNARATYYWWYKKTKKVLRAGFGLTRKGKQAPYTPGVPRRRGSLAGGR